MADGVLPDAGPGLLVARGRFLCLLGSGTRGERFFCLTVLQSDAVGTFGRAGLENRGDLENIEGEVAEKICRGRFITAERRAFRSPPSLQKGDLPDSGDRRLHR